MNKHKHVSSKDSNPPKPESEPTVVKNTGYDDAYIQALIDKARKSWSDVKDADEWLSEIRGYDDLPYDQNTKTP